jgi:two-component system invasion response regulator UvrY
MLYNSQFHSTADSVDSFHKMKSVNSSIQEYLVEVEILDNIPSLVLIMYPKLPEETAAMIRILIAVQQPVIREGLKQIITARPDTHVTDEAGNSRELRNKVTSNYYDVVMLDISIPGGNWLEIVKDLRNQKTHLSILVLGSHADEDIARRAFKAGASGYLTTDCSSDELLTALKKVSSGGKYVCASLSERMAFDLEKGTKGLPHESLSNREYQVMSLLASGKIVSEIADEMVISVKTVSTYRSRILEKLDLKNNVELARYYTRFVDTKTLQCKKCGQDNPRVAKFCAFCGSALDITSELDDSMQDSSPALAVHIKLARFFRKHKWAGASLAIVVLAVALISWRTFFTSPSVEDTNTTPSSAVVATTSVSDTNNLPTTPAEIQATSLPPLNTFMKGIHFADWKSFDAPDTWRGLYPSPAIDLSLKELTAIGVNWISLVVIRGQETISSTTISHDTPATATDAELLRVINGAHNLGMRVMLWPDIIVYNDLVEHCAGEIGMDFTSEAQWQDWFTSYRDSINYYATFAQEAGVDLLCIGAGLGSTTHREADWRQVIQEIRERYKGPITYSALNTATWGFPGSEEDRIQWWDAVDYIGISAFYELTNKNDPTVAELKAAWTDRGYMTLIENLSKRFNKEIIFTQIGYVDKDGNNKTPGNFNINTPTDSQEQADCYQAALEVLQGKQWFKGIFWWQWSATLAQWPENPRGKPAEDILKKFYLSDLYK